MYGEAVGYAIVHSECDGPPPVLVHGWPDTERLWAPTVAALRPHYRCLRFTWPGFAPGAPRTLQSFDESVDLLARIVERAGGGAPVTLLLHDCGCPFGSQFALHHPGRVARVISVDVGDAGSREHWRELGVTAKATTVAYQTALAAAWKLGGTAGDAIARRIARAARAPAPADRVHAGQGWPYYVAWTGARGGYRRAQRFAPAIPMLYVYGARKPFMFHSTAWAHAIAARPQCRVLGLPGGHWVMHAQQAAFNQAVLAWLNETGARTSPGRVAGSDGAGVG